MKKFQILALLLFFTTAGIHAQSTYYVSATQGNDSNDGRGQKTAFANISRAASVTQPGDIVKILPGTYRGSNPDNLYDEFLISRSGSPGNYITYQGVADEQGNRPVLESASLSGLTVNNSSYIIIDNVALVPGAEDRKGLITNPDFGLEVWRRRRGVNVVNNSHHVIIRNLYIHDFPGNGIGIGGSDVMLVENNLVEHCAYETNNANSGISIYQALLLDVPGFSEYPDHRLIFRDNTCRYNTNLRGFAGSIGGNRVTDGNGIIIDDLRRVQVPEGTPSVSYAGRTLVIGNVCYGNGGYGINIFSSDRVDVYNNTLFDNGQSARIEDPAYEVAIQSAQLQLGDLDDVNVVNNILANATASTITYTRFNATNLNFRTNIHWNTSGTVENVSENDLIADPEFVQAQGLTPEQTELLATMTNPFDPNSPSAQLRTPTQNNGFPIPDLRLREGSPAIDAGSEVGLRTPAGDGIDIGAFEYKATNPPPPPPTNPGNVVVRARGTTGSEQIEVRYQDKRVGEAITLSTDFEEYTLSVDNPNGNFKVAFINDNGRSDVYVDWLRVGATQSQAESQETNTGAWARGACGRGSFTEVMQCNGYIDFGTLGSGSNEGNIVVQAKGSVGSEQMSLLIDGDVKKSWTVSTRVASYSYTGYRGGNVSLRFDNDGGSGKADRNLAIDYLEACGVKYQDSQGSSSLSNSCQDSFGGFTWLWCEGSLYFGDLGCSSNARRVATPDKPATRVMTNKWFRSYPNPVSERLTVEGSEDYQITLYDLNGQVVMRHDHLRGSAKLDVSRLQPGVYIVKMSDVIHPLLQQRIVVE